MKDKKRVSYYDLSVEALNKALGIADFTSGVENLLSDADQIRDWLIKNANFETQTTVGLPSPSKYVYYADEPVNRTGQYPAHTYWYRLDTETGEFTFVTDYSEERKPTSDHRGMNRDRVQEDYGWLTEVTDMTKIPERAL